MDIKPVWSHLRQIIEKAFNGMCLLIVQATEEAGDIKITATTDGLKNGALTLKSK